MASISTPEVKVGIGMSSTWQTARLLSAANVGKIFHLSQLDFTANFGNFDPPDIGFQNFFTTAVNLELNVQVSGSGSFTYDGAWLQLLAAFLGSTTASPTEITVGQGDYTHVMDFTSSIIGKYVTMCALIEDDYVVEMPSVKITSFKLGGSVNGVPTFSFTGIADKVVPTPSSPINSAAVVAALTVPTYNPAVLGDTNHYFRLNAQAGAGLSSGDNKPILNWSIEYGRPINTRFELNGALSKYTKEPYQAAPTTGLLTFQLGSIDDSVIDFLTDYLAGNPKKAELFLDGLLIGTTTKRSHKIQMPYLFPENPSGYGVPNNSSLMQPTLQYRMLQASAAPTGMTGVTNYSRHTVIDTRVQSYFN